MIGQALGHYRIIEKIGSGGMGEVYRAHDDQLDRDVALKVLPTGALVDEESRKLLHKEALILAKLNHPNIATIHEFSSQDGVDFLVMEFIRGKSLKEMLKEGPLADKQTLWLGPQLADGLAAAHEHGIVHRDLKPANIMIVADTRLKILDFGLAKVVQNATNDLAQSSRTNDGIAGTLPYMAPEQLRGQPTDARTDIYAAGAVLYEMTTGQRPFPETNSARLIDSILHQTPRPPCELNRQLSPAIQAVIMKALEKIPEYRYRSIGEVGLELVRANATVGNAPPCQPLEQTQVPLEIAHILFMDIVQYSMLPMDEQRLRLRQLQTTVRNTKEFIRARSGHKLVSLPTGDGIALVFFGDPEAPVRCAVELSGALKAAPEIKLRMGIHTGPVYRVADINANRNVSGGGINLAQRVMDCGDAGHILLSKTVVDVLGQLSQWPSSLHDLGEVEVKHGVRVHIFNFYTEEVGNPDRPAKLKTAKTSRKQSLGSARRNAGSGSRPSLEAQKPSQAMPPVSESPRSDSTSTRTVQITLPEVPRWGWLIVAGCILISGALTLSIPKVRKHVLDRWFYSVTPTPRLAVLPFTDQNPLGWVAAGLGEELSRKLSAFVSLPVVSPTDAETVGQKQKLDLSGPVVTIAKNLGVNLVVRGSVREDRGWTYVSVTLDDMAKSRQILKSFSGLTANIDLLGIEDQVYSEILKELRLKPNAKERARAVRPTRSRDAYDQYLKACSALRGHRDTGEIEAAIEFYTHALNEDPHFALAYAGLSIAYLDMYRKTKRSPWLYKALERAQQGQKANDSLPEVHLALGDVYLKLKSYGQAISEFKRVSELLPGSDQPWLQLGEAYEAAGDKGDAINAYMNATRMNPDSLVDLNELGAVYLHYGEFEQALDQFRRVVEIDPDNFNGHMNEGIGYYFQSKYDECISEFETALKIRPDDAEIISNLGTLYFAQRNYRESAEKFEKAATLVNPNDPNAYKIFGNLGDAYRALGQKQKAAENYVTAIRLAKTLDVNQKDKDVLGDLALYCAKTGDIASAQDYINKARSIDPEAWQLLFDEAVVKLLANQPTRAIEALKLALEKGLPRDQLSDPEFNSLQSNPEFQRLVPSQGPS